MLLGPLRPALKVRADDKALHLDLIEDERAKHGGHYRGKNKWQELIDCLDAGVTDVFAHPGSYNS